MSYWNCAWITGKFCSLATDIDFFSTKHHMHYSVIRAILGDNCNMPVKKTPSPGSHGLLLKGAAWLYNDRSARRGKGRVGEQQEKKSFQSGWTDQLPWTPCCSGQARVPVTSCLTLILSAKFPEGNSCRCLQTSVSAHSTQGCMPSPLFHEVLIFFLLTLDENARIPRFPDSYLVDNLGWGVQTLAITRASLPGLPRVGSRWVET